MGESPLAAWASSPRPCDLGPGKGPSSSLLQQSWAYPCCESYASSQFFILFWFARKETGPKSARMQLLKRCMASRCPADTSWLPNWLATCCPAMAGPHACMCLPSPRPPDIVPLPLEQVDLHVQ